MFFDTAGSRLDGGGVLFFSELGFAFIWGNVCVLEIGEIVFRDPLVVTF